MKLDELQKVLECVAQTFQASEVEVVTAPINNARVRLIKLSLPPAHNLYFLPSEHFPEAPPTIFVQWGDGLDREYLNFIWPVDGDPAAKIVAALKLFIHPSPSYRLAYGIDPARPLSEDLGVGLRAQWRRLLTGAALVPSSSEIALSRTDPNLVHALANCTVLIVGLGSVGSYMAEQLVRSGIGRLILIDSDIVENGNLSRTTYDRNDVGISKVCAIERKLLNIAPDLNLDIFDVAFQTIPSGRLRELFDSADLVVAATDDPMTQAQINSCAQFSDIPALFVGLYRGAKGGEVVITVPALTPCFRCQIGATRLPSDDGSRVGRAVDYGTGRLQGEIALNCDIQHVSSSALKLAMSLLAALKNVDIPLASFTIGAVQNGLHMLTIGMEPDWWFYPEIFNGTAGQYAYQSVWLTSERNIDCPDCGDNTDRTDPFQSLSGHVNIDDLRQQVFHSDDGN